MAVCKTALLLVWIVVVFVPEGERKQQSADGTVAVALPLESRMVVFRTSCDDVGSAVVDEVGPCEWARSPLGSDVERLADL